MTATKKLAFTIVEVVVDLGSVIGHGADVWEFVGVLGVGEEVDKEPEAFEALLISKGLSRLELILREPERHAVARVVREVALDLEGHLDEPVIPNVGLHISYYNIMCVCV